MHLRLPALVSLVSLVVVRAVGAVRAAVLVLLAQLAQLVRGGALLVVEARHIRRPRVRHNKDKTKLIRLTTQSLITQGTMPLED